MNEKLTNIQEFLKNYKFTISGLITGYSFAYIFFIITNVIREGLSQLSWILSKDFTFLAFKPAFYNVIPVVYFGFLGFFYDKTKNKKLLIVWISTYLVLILLDLLFMRVSR